jgi:hypothetical protein
LQSVSSRTDYRINWQGWPQSVMLSVGLLAMDFPNGKSAGCTATVIGRALLITAAHCIWSAEDGGYATAVVFAPGVTWNDFNNPDKSDIRTPLGVWGATHWWVPQGWANDNTAAGFDYALVEINPASTGYLSDFTGGAWSATWNISYGSSTHIYIAGYPANGYWGTLAGGLGRGQYGCDATIDGSYRNENGGYAIWAPCSMNQGSSGGPWFVQLNDGSWTIGAVTSRCYDSTGNKCAPWAEAQLGTFLGRGFGEFFNAVWPLVRWH